MNALLSEYEFEALPELGVGLGSSLEGDREAEQFFGALSNLARRGVGWLTTPGSPQRQAALTLARQALNQGLPALGQWGGQRAASSLGGFLPQQESEIRDQSRPQDLSRRNDGAPRPCGGGGTWRGRSRKSRRCHDPARCPCGSAGCPRADAGDAGAGVRSVERRSTAAPGSDHPSAGASHAHGRAQDCCRHRTIQRHGRASQSGTSRTHACPTDPAGSRQPAVQRPGVPPLAGPRPEIPPPWRSNRFE